MVAWGNVIIVRTRVQRPTLNVTTKADTKVYSVDIYVNETKENLKLGGKLWDLLIFERWYLLLGNAGTCNP